jgi:tetratricopeptide (TPR) repeat protein
VAAIPFLLILLFVSSFLLVGISSGAEKKAKKPALAAAKEIAINDSNVKDSLKKAEEQLKKGETDNALTSLLKIHDYADDVLKTVKFIQVQYEKAVGDSSMPQGEREDIYLKLRRLGQLTPKYTAIREASAYDIGYAYAKKGDSERARKYLIKVFETAPFSTKQDSAWMKSKKLLLGLYNLEGEF